MISAKNVQDINTRIEKINTQRTKAEARAEMLRKQLETEIASYEKQFGVSLRGKDFKTTQKLISEEVLRVSAQVEGEYSLKSRVVEAIEKGDYETAYSLLGVEVKEEPEEEITNEETFESEGTDEFESGSTGTTGTESSENFEGFDDFEESSFLEDSTDEEEEEFIEDSDDINLEETFEGFDAEEEEDTEESDNGLRSEVLDSEISPDMSFEDEGEDIGGLDFLSMVAKNNESLGKAAVSGNNKGNKGVAKTATTKSTGRVKSSKPGMSNGVSMNEAFADISVVDEDLPELVDEDFGFGEMLSGTKFSV